MSKHIKRLREREFYVPPKYIEPTTEGKCPYCKKHVKSLEAHVKAKHKGEKLLKQA